MDGLAEFNISKCRGDKNPECILILTRDNDCKLGFGDIYILQTLQLLSLVIGIHCTHCIVLNNNA